MDDTPQHIKDLQLKIWLSKPPGERLRQAIVDNEAFFKWVEEDRKNIQRIAKSSAGSEGIDPCEAET